MTPGPRSGKDLPSPGPSIRSRRGLPWKAGQTLKPGKRIARASPRTLVDRYYSVAVFHRQGNPGLSVQAAGPLQGRAFHRRPPGLRDPGTPQDGRNPPHALRPPGRPRSTQGHPDGNPSYHPLSGRTVQGSLSRGPLRRRGRKIRVSRREKGR